MESVKEEILRENKESDGYAKINFPGQGPKTQGRKRDYLKMIYSALPPAILIALVTGVTSVIGQLIPIVMLCNITCCLWLVLGGVISVYLLKRKTGDVDMVDGALVGALTGFLYAIFYMVILFVTILTTILLAANMMGMPITPRPAGMFTIESFASLVILFVVTLSIGIISSILGSIGGVIGAKLLEK